LSSVLPFHRKYFRYNVNIPTGLTLERQRIIPNVERPWATGLTRLLTDRRLKKGDLAELAGVRPGTISAVANSPKAPDVATLQRLADGFTKHDRKGHPHAPAVGLWEFFVSDEQAALLRQSAKAQETLIRREEVASLLAREMAPHFETAVDRLTAALTGQPAPQQTIPTGSAPQEDAPPAASLARGKLRRNAS
jgi:transcriptional regulator with XRE-family HTH domain